MSEPAAPSPKPQKQKLTGFRKWRVRLVRISIAIVVLVVLFRVALSLLLPVAINRAAGFYGMDCDYGRVKLGLFGGYAVLWDVNVTPKGKSDTLLHANFCEASISTWALLRGHLSVWRVGADGVTVNVTRNVDGKIPLLELIASPPATQPAKTATIVARTKALDLSAPFQVEAFRLTRVTVNLVDEAVKPAFKASINTDLRVSDIGMADRPATMDITVQSDGLIDELRLNGEARSTGRDINAKMRLSGRGIRPDALASYLRLLGIRATGEELNLVGNATLKTTAAPDSLTALKGEAVLRDVRLFTGNNDNVVKVGSITLEPRFVDLGRIDLGRVTINDITTNVQRNENAALAFAGMELGAQPIAPTTRPTAAAPTTAPSSVPKLSLDALVISNVRLAFADKFIPGGAKLELVLKKLELDNIATYATTQPAAPVTLSAELESPHMASAITLKGNASVFGEQKTADLHLNIAGITLEAIKPYLDAAGVESTFQNGQFNCELNAKFGATPEGVLQGGVTLKDLSLEDGQTLLKLADGQVTDWRIDPRTNEVSIGALDLSGPTIKALRDNDGVMHLFGLKTRKVAVAAAPAQQPTAAAAEQPAASAAPAAPATQPAAAVSISRIELHRLTWKDIRFELRDESVKPAVELAMTDAGFELKNLAVNLQPTTRPSEPGDFVAWATIPALLESARAQGQITLSSTAAKLSVSADATGLKTTPLAPYFAGTLIEPTIRNGAFTVKADLSADMSGNATRLDATVRDIALTDGDQKLLSLVSAQIENAQLSNRIAVDRAVIVRPFIQIAQNADNSMDELGLHVSRPNNETPLLDLLRKLPPPPDTQCTELRVEDAQLKAIDRHFVPTVELPIHADITFSNFQIGPHTAPGKVSAKARIDGSINEIVVDATFSASPTEYDLDSRISATGIHSGPLDAYLGEGRSIATADGRFTTALTAKITQRPEGGIAGHVQLHDLMLNDAQTPLLAIGGIALSCDRLDPSGQTISVDELSVTGIRADAFRRQDGTFDLIAVKNAPGTVVYKAAPAPKAGPAQALESKEAAELITQAHKALPEVSVTKLLISADQITFTDQARPKAAPVVIEDLQLRNADRLVWLGAKATDQPANRYELSMRISPVVDSIIANLDVAPFAANPTAQLRFTASGIRGDGIAKVIPELAQKIDFATLNNGEISAKIDLSAKIERRGPAEFDFRQGFTVDLTLSGLELRNAGEKRALAGIQEIRINSARIDPAKHLITIPNLEISNPHASIYRSPAGLRLAGVTVKPTAAGQGEAQMASASVRPQAQPSAAPSTQPAAALPFDCQIRKLTVSGLDFLYEDKVFEPNVYFPLTQLDAEVSDIGTLSLKQARPVRFNVLMEAGKVPLPSTKGGGAGEREVFSLVTANGVVTLYPQPTGWAKVSLNGLELVAFKGAGKSQKIDISNGLFDGEVDVRVTGQQNADVRAKAILTDLSLTEEQGGPIQSALKLQVPLDSAVKMLEDPDGSITVPVNFSITNGEVTWSQLYASATGGAAQAVGTGIASSPIKLAQGVLGGGGKEEQPRDAPKTAIYFEPGDASLSAADTAGLQDMIKRLHEDKNAQLTLRHMLSNSDVSIEEIRSNPQMADAQDLVAGLWARKTQLLREREALLIRTNIRIASMPASATQDDLARLRDLNLEIYQTDASLEKALELFRPGADRQANRRTRGACVALGQARLDSIKAYLLASDIKDIDKRIEIAPASGQVSEDPMGNVLVTLVTRKR